MASTDTDNYLRYGDEFVIIGRSDSTLTRSGNDASRRVGSHPEAGVVLRVVAAAAGNDNGDVVMTNVPVYLVDASNGDVFERTTLMYDDHHWEVGRFALGFVPCDASTQTAMFSRDPNGSTREPIEFGQDIGVNFGGFLPVRHSRTHPGTADRRFLTVRSADEPTCVVDHFQGDEHLILMSASQR